MQKVVPHLWFDKEAVEAAQWYMSLFEDSKMLQTQILQGTPSGEVQTVDFQLAGIQFSAISAGPYFAFNPSVSLMVSCVDAAEVDELYHHLVKNGDVLMPLGDYPFSKRYAWIQDRFGLNWQLMLNEGAAENQKIRPNLLFAGEACGKAKAALDYYLSVFEGSEKKAVSLYEPGEADDSRAEVKYSEFLFKENQFILMDHGLGGDFSFNEAISFMILCVTQAEIDYYWDKLSFVPEAEQCGWVKDQFGVSWQIVPARLNELLSTGTEKEIDRVTQTMLKMKKLDIERLENAKRMI